MACFVGIFFPADPELDKWKKYSGTLDLREKNMV